jgi:hypothetical protein
LNVISARSGNEDVKMLVLDFQNAVDHWPGLHNACATRDQNRKCVRENWSYSRRYYEPGGETHKAIQLWFRKHITKAKFSHYKRGRENYLLEILHGLINRYA